MIASCTNIAWNRKKENICEREWNCNVYYRDINYALETFNNEILSRTECFEWHACTTELEINQYQTDVCLCFLIYMELSIEDPIRVRPSIQSYHSDSALCYIVFLTNELLHQIQQLRASIVSLWWKFNYNVTVIIRLFKSNTNRRRSSNSLRFLGWITNAAGRLEPVYCYLSRLFRRRRCQTIGI